MSGPVTGHQWNVPCVSASQLTIGLYCCCIGCDVCELRVIVCHHWSLDSTSISKRRDVIPKLCHHWSLVSTSIAKRGHVVPTLCYHWSLVSTGIAKRGHVIPTMCHHWSLFSTRIAKRGHIIPTMCHHWFLVSTGISKRGHVIPTLCHHWSLVSTSIAKKGQDTLPALYYASISGTVFADRGISGMLAPNQLSRSCAAIWPVVHVARGNLFFSARATLSLFLSQTREDVCRRLPNTQSRTHSLLFLLERISWSVFISFCWFIILFSLVYRCSFNCRVGVGMEFLEWLKQHPERKPKKTKQKPLG